ncbi:hypothetical protein [Pseudomonas sp. FSL R10-1339]|uniref:hypothetical protein n=1 Tax=Pseudomonas sp. FSL R10-1339 TaxID=2662196 RepID=UPI001295847D|nr:hypothetical protein [Pseudomonas sp. FSL R10-1339]MQU52907.1 hypothetical protein [Pseudomonas sp. FSL R10-1339]
MAAKALTKKIITDLEKYITQTTSLKIACGCAGVPSSTFYAWQKAAKEIEEEGKGESDLTKDELLLLEFLERIDLAKAKSCKPAIDAVMKAIKQGDANQAARLLSRRMPEEFGDWNRKEVTIRTETTEETTTGIALIPSMGGDSDLDLMLQQQQSDALLLAKTKTSELS